MLANKITLHGSPAIKDLENQIRFRFVADAKKKLNRETAIKRIFFYRLKSFMHVKIIIF
jgi:hypothetical protein